MPRITIRSLGQADIALGLRLSQAAGWNQTPADWRRALALAPAGAFVGQLDDLDVGTVVGFRFGSVAWIALMLVDPAARGQGVGRALMQHALAQLDAAGVSTIRLDATPLGQPLYASLGFEVDYGLERFAGTPQGETTRSCETVRRVEAPDLEPLVRYDQSATGTPRGALLSALWQDRPESAWWIGSAESPRGLLLSRLGNHATQLGPCIAEPDAGETLLEHALSMHRGQLVYVDALDAHTAAREKIRRWGLTPQRRVTRMTRGSRVIEQPERLWASSGPEKG